MNQINQSAVSTVPRHSGICRRMTPHVNTCSSPFTFLAAQKKPSHRHIHNMATWSTLPRVPPHQLLPYAPSQGNSPGNETEQQKTIGRFPSTEPAAIIFPGNHRPLLPDLPGLVSLSAGMLRHVALQALTYILGVTVSVREAKQAMIHSLGSLLATFTALSRIKHSCVPPETLSHVCTLVFLICSESSLLEQQWGGGWEWWDHYYYYLLHH